MLRKEFGSVLQGRTLSDNGGGGVIHVFVLYDRRISFEINSNSKEIRRTEHEYLNKNPPN